MKRFWTLIKSPSTRFSFGALVLGGLLAGAVGFQGFEYVIHETSTDEFCLLCHSGDIGLEMAGRPHYDNATGLRATCADCHLPKAFWPKVFYKTKAGIKDTYHHFVLGTISTPEKFEAHRMHMATVTWKAMYANDSRECRVCHDQSKWDLASQRDKARDYHSPALTNGKTCIDCHKGIAHELPQGILPDEQLPGIDPVEEVAKR